MRKPSTVTFPDSGMAPMAPCQCNERTAEVPNDRHVGGVDPTNTEQSRYINRKWADKVLPVCGEGVAQSAGIQVDSATRSATNLCATANIAKEPC